jgi:PIN domain nuclease of toxin-antitoxin system
MLLLDTHILVFALEGQLRPGEEDLLKQDRWSVPDIVFWELQLLEKRGRIAPILESAEFARVLRRIRVWPIDLDVVRAMRQLDFRSDPADELIAATSIAHGIPLLTRDTTMLKSGVVPLALA